MNRPTELPAAHDPDLVDQFLQESDYLPARGDQSWGDQSWREQAALGIAAGYEESDEIETPATIPTRNDRLSEPNFDGRSGKGALLAALFVSAILVPGAVILTAPEILTADFWRADRVAANPPSKPAPPVRTASVPAPVIPMEAPPQPSRVIAEKPRATRTAKATPHQTPPLRPTDSAQDLNAASSANAPPDRASPPKQQPATRMVKREEAGGFGSFVLGPDGKMQYRYFPAASSGQTAEPAQAEGDDPGFYAMVPGTDGVLRYKHFPSKPTH